MHFDKISLVYNLWDFTAASLHVKCLNASLNLLNIYLRYIYIGILKNSHLEIRLLLGSLTKIEGFGYFFEYPKLDSFPVSSYVFTLWCWVTKHWFNCPWQCSLNVLPLQNFSDLLHDNSPVLHVISFTVYVFNIWISRLLIYEGWTEAFSVTYCSLV